MDQEVLEHELSALFDRSRTAHISSDSRYVIFSDLHLGDGGRNDDFRRNSDLFQAVTREHYLSRGYSLVLNGDIEELQRFSVEQIGERWGGVYEIFRRFSAENRLFKIFGNHDFEFSVKPRMVEPFETMESLRLRHSDGDIFILHGHQTAGRLERPNIVVGYILRYVANPLGIPNGSVAHDSRKRYTTEQRLYDFSRSRKIVSILGHTHRPLFESLSKIDSLKFAIERLCRDYVTSDEPQRRRIEEGIQEYKSELESMDRAERKRDFHESLYTSGVLVPCLFNSGCVVGKRGITCLEITSRDITLAHWFDPQISRKYLNYHGQPAEQLTGTNYYRSVLNTDRLDYVFSRIKLLG